MSRRAAQHPRYPTGSVPRKTERIEATCGFRFASVSGREESLHRHVDDCRHPAFDYGRNSCFPIRARHELRRSVGQHKVRHALGRVRRNPLPDRPTQRQSAESKLRNLQPSARARISLPNISIEYSPAVASEAPWPRVSYRRIWKCGSRSVDLKVPHRMVRADRVGQDQDRQSRISLQPVEHPRIVNGCEGQIIGSLSSFSRSDSDARAFRKASADPDIAPAFPIA